MRLEADPRIFAQALAVILGAAMISSVYPLLRLRRRSLAEALRQD
jgi:ABC-type antimicrobial peptide transport system permease subunit